MVSVFGAAAKSPVEAMVDTGLEVIWTLPLIILTFFLLLELATATFLL